MSAEPKDDQDVEVIIEEEKPADDTDAPKKDDAKPEEDDSGEEVKQEDKPKKKKTRRDDAFSQQVRKLMWEKQEAADRAAKLEEELVAERTARAKMEGITTQSLEDSLQSKSGLLTRQLEAAHAEQDAAKIANVTAELSKVEAQKAQLERYKIENSTKAQQKSVEKPARQEHQEADTSFDGLYETGTPQMRSWLDTNRDWYHPDSENFNQDMVDDVTAKASKLEQEWARTGRASDIGTRAYFNAINRYIEDNWTSESDKPVQTQNKTGYAAPVNNRSSSSRPDPKKDVVTLTREEREMALNIEIKHKNGRSYTDEEKIKEFATNKRLLRNSPANEPININTLRKVF